MFAPLSCFVGMVGLETFRIQASSVQFINVFQLSSTTLLRFLTPLQTSLDFLRFILKRKRCSIPPKSAFKVAPSTLFLRLDLRAFPKSNSSGKTSAAAPRCDSSSCLCCSALSAERTASPPVKRCVFSISPRWKSSLSAKTPVRSSSSWRSAICRRFAGSPRRRTR